MIFIGAVPPLMLKTDNNPGGLPLSVFDGLRSGLVENRSQFYKDTSVGFFSYNRPNAKVSEAVEDEFWRLGMQSGIKPSYDCIEQFSETDFTEDLKKIDVPALFLHGDDDQIVPYADSSVLAVKLVQDGTLKIYPGFSHGMAITEAGTIDRDLLAFIRS
jgi:non-heme chloroperoxidase